MWKRIARDYRLTLVTRGTFRTGLTWGARTTGRTDRTSWSGISRYAINTVCTSGTRKTSRSGRARGSRNSFPSLLNAKSIHQIDSETIKDESKPTPGAPWGPLNPGSPGMPGRAGPKGDSVS